MKMAKIKKCSSKFKSDNIYKNCFTVTMLWSYSYCHIRDENDRKGSSD